MTDEDRRLRCDGCERVLLDNSQPQTTFAAVVHTRAQALPGDGPRFTEFTRYPAICSRECFDKVVSTWERAMPPVLNPMPALLPVDDEWILVMWDKRPFSIPSRIIDEIRDVAESGR
jgi:hypothetical protein